MHMEFTIEKLKLQLFHHVPWTMKTSHKNTEFSSLRHFLDKCGWTGLNGCFFLQPKISRQPHAQKLWILKFHLQQEQSKSDISTESYSSFPQPCSLFFNCFLPYMAIFSQPQSAQNSILKADFPHTKPFPGHWWNKKFQMRFSQKKKSHLKHPFNPVHPQVEACKYPAF